MLGATVVYATVAAERVPGLVAGLGSAGIALLVFGAVIRVSDLVPLGVALAGSAYVLSVVTGEGGVDLRAPAVAGALVLAAELAYTALEPPLAPAVWSVRLRRAGRTAGTLLGATGVAAVVLLASVAELGSPAMLEAAGILSAVAALTLLALLARRLT